MSSFVLAVLAFGLGGVDPLGAVLVAGALAAGASRRGAAAFAAVAGVVTVGVGVAASQLIGPLIGSLDLRFSWVSDSTWLVVNVVLLVALLLWGLRRVLRGPTLAARRPRRRRSVSVGAMVVGGVVFGLSALTDPTYYAVIALAGRDQSAWPTVAGMALWFLVSQCPLLAVTIAAAFGLERSLVQRAKRVWTRLKPLARKTLTVTIFLAVAVLVADTTSYLVRGRFLIG